MTREIPEILAIIAGNGAYPLQLAESARKQGVGRLFAVAFKKETDTRIEECVDEVEWLHMGQLQALFDALQNSGARHVVMAGQLKPTALFHVRLDARARGLLKGLKVRNAETIFGAVGDELKRMGIKLLPAHAFMEACMLGPGVLTARTPTAEEQADIELGFSVARTTSGLDIGQTVVVKEGTIIAVEAFEGTDATIARAGELCGPGAVVVKVAKQGHDMRFDIPVVGTNTIKLLKKARAAVLAVEAGRSILLEREKVIAAADKQGIALVAVERG